jgi:hypothetical protein
VDRDHRDRAARLRRRDLLAGPARERERAPAKAEIAARFEVRIAGQHEHDLAAQVHALVAVKAERGRDHAIAAEHDRRVRKLRAARGSGRTP